MSHAVLRNDYVEENLKFSFVKTQLRKLIHYRIATRNQAHARIFPIVMIWATAFTTNGLMAVRPIHQRISKSENDVENCARSKYRRLAEMVNLQPGDRVLEIGCGWGGFAEFAARHYDVHITGITNFQEQFDFAKKRIHKASLSTR